jgi:hypothetical protein
MIKHEGYGFFNLEVLAISAALALLGATLGLIGNIPNRLVGAALAAALIVLFIDVQLDWITAWDVRALLPLILAFAVAWLFEKNTWRVLAAIFATVIVSTIAIPEDRTLTKHSDEAAVAPQDRNLPILLHLILDEHAGIDAIPADVQGGPELQARIRSFYRGHGFTLYGQAFSQYIDSVDSISHVMNLATTPTDGIVQMTWQQEGGQGFHWRMQRNDYLTQLAGNRYRLLVHQSRYLDLCGDIPALKGRCQTHPIGIGALRGSKLPRAHRVQVMASTLLTRSFFYGKVRSAYNRLAASESGQSFGLPSWSWERDRVGPISAESIFAQLERNIANAGPGDAIIAHLLMPHDPYAYAADCRLRSPGDWLGRSMFNRYTAITPSIRALYYGRYIAQVQCLYRRLDTLMNAVARSRYPDRFHVVLHGDHGARLGLRYPRHGSGSELQAVDYRDNYGTLFAVRASGLEAAYRSDVRSVQELFATFIRNDFDLSTLNRDEHDPPYVYITSRNRALFPVERCAMQGFAEVRSASAPAPSNPADGAGLTSDVEDAESRGDTEACQVMSNWQEAGAYGPDPNANDQTPGPSIEAAGR